MEKLVTVRTFNSSILKDGGYLADSDFEPSTEIRWINKILQKFRKKVD